MRTSRSTIVNRLISFNFTATSSFIAGFSQCFRKKFHHQRMPHNQFAKHQAYFLYFLYRRINHKLNKSNARSMKIISAQVYSDYSQHDIYKQVIAVAPMSGHQ